jgi:glutamate synthase (NADPH) large chain
VYRKIAAEHGTYLLEDLWEEFRVRGEGEKEDSVGDGRAKAIDIAMLESETTQGAIERLKQEAVKAVSDGAELLVLTDRTVFEGERRWIDPHLATSAVDQALKSFNVKPDEVNLRRRCSIVLRSASVRNVHDVCLALGLGANGVCPYVMVEVICVDEYESDISNLCSALRKGIEKVISTIGIHESRGYARQFSSIGIRPELAEIFQTEAFAASEKGGVGFSHLDADTDQRHKILSGEEAAKPAKTFRFYPKVYKAAVAASNGSATYEEYSQKVRELEAESPISMRHIMGLRKEPDREPVDPADVDASVGHHDYPVVISSMSFGSQSEPAFRAYAEAAKRINILCINGEGGEIQDMYGNFRKWRGQQVASGRFGVSAEMLNSSYVAEIKIGQGAKPGEGGHLPGKKVSEKVAAARNASPGTDLISPSNNHDLYSIEDLAELIDELKTVNPDLRVSVKVPVVPNVGTIGLGIAKAGADIITLSGFEGGTGAARQHALRHTGLPSDIGTRAVHRALMEAGIRNRVEIWADGGYRHAHDIVKLHCMGANRVAFGTLAMVSLGCTICRGCQLDTCHVGIATQIETVEQAQEHGLKKFTPVEDGAESSARFFQAMGEEVKQVVGSLGYDRAQDLVGRYDLLEQISHEDRVDLAELITPLEEYLDLEPIDLPVEEKELVEARAEAGLVRAKPIRMEPKQASAEIAKIADKVFDGSCVTTEFPRPTDANDRVLGTELSGAIARARIYEGAPEGTQNDELAELNFNGGSVAGQGFGAFNEWGVTCRVEGGAQDGVAKTMLGGTVSIMKGRNADGKRINGSVGKSFAYGAQRGRLFVQGSADSRFCIRLSGADVVLGGEPEEPLDDSKGCIVDRANAKGFAFEYMTSGRAVVLGDIGPWACAGMTGGRIYARVDEELGLTRETIESRLGAGAKVSLQELDAEGQLDLEDLLGHYAAELRATDQADEAKRIDSMLGDAKANFLMIIPEKVQADPSISTE